MAIYAVKRKDETNERLIKRFKKQFQNARLLQELRACRYFKQSDTKRIKRKKAVMRNKFRKKRAREQFYS